MINKVVVAISAVTIAFGLVVFVWFFTANYRDSTDLESIEDFERVSWFEIRTGRVGRFYKTRINRGYYGNWPSSVVPLTAIAPINPLSYNQYGVSYLSLFTGELKNSVYSRQEARPYRLLSILKTSIGKEEYYIFVTEWLSKNSNADLLLFTVSAQEYIDIQGEVNGNLLNLLSGNSTSFVAPLVKIRDYEACIVVMGSGVEYCRWLTRNSARVVANYEYWQANLRLPWYSGTIPLVFAPITTSTPVGIDQ